LSFFKTLFQHPTRPIEVQLFTTLKLTQKKYQNLLFFPTSPRIFNIKNLHRKSLVQGSVGWGRDKEDYFEKECFTSCLSKYNRDHLNYNLRNLLALLNIDQQKRVEECLL